MTAYRGSDRGHVTLRFRASVRDRLRGENEALCRTHTTQRETHMKLKKTNFYPAAVIHQCQLPTENIVCICIKAMELFMLPCIRSLETDEPIIEYILHYKYIKKVQN